MQGISSIARPAVLIALFGLVFLLRLDSPGLFDYDEACYAEVARGMHERGDWSAPELNGEPFFEKPPFLYWTQILGYHVFGVGPFGARFFNALAGLALVLLVYAFSRRPLGEGAAFWAALFLGTALEFLGLARTAFTDMFLALWLVCCLGSFHRANEAWRDDPRSGTGWFLLACFFSGVAMLAKGAVGAVLPGVTILIFALLERRIAPLLRPARAVGGLVLLLGVGLSWYLLLGLTHAGGFGFMRELFLEHHVGRFTTPMQGHSGPIFFYVPVLIVGFLPWSPFLIPALGGLGIHRSEGLARRYLGLMSIFAAVTFVFFSIAATKLPNYIAPVLPVAAMLAGHAFDLARRRATPFEKRWQWAVWLTAGMLALLAALLAGSSLILHRVPAYLGPRIHKVPALIEPFDFGGTHFVGAAILLGSAVAGVLAFRRGRITACVGSYAAGVILLYLVGILWIAPRFDAHFQAPFRTLAREAASIAPEGRRLVLVGIRRRPSATFYGGLRTRYVSRNLPDQIAALFHGPGPEVGIVAEPILDRIREHGPVEVLDRRGGWVLFRCRPGVRHEGAGMRDEG
jgi:4-amino-4-deoxy-L-arabinose transferase-like glycosyltransferase